MGSARYTSSQALELLTRATIVAMAPKLSAYERIEWLRMRHPQKPGMRQFGPLVGMSEGWLSTLKVRAKDNPDATIDVPTAKKVAAATGARLEWITEGVGEPFKAAVAAADRYPERETALKDYPDLPDDVRREVMSMRFHSGSRPTVARWKSYIEATLLAKAKGERFGKPRPDEDDAPPEARRS